MPTRDQRQRRDIGLAVSGKNTTSSIRSQTISTKINTCMRIHEILEGPHDPYIHKAIFFAGSPGAGKTYVARKLAGVFQGLKQVNMDNIFKFLMTKKNLSWKMPPGEEPEREKQRQRSKELVTKQQQRYTDGGLGLLIDSTGRMYDTIAKIKQELEDKGYATTMVFVNTDLETALRRNKERERTLPDELVHKNYAVIEQNLGRFSRLFDDIHIIDNSASAQGELPDALEMIEKDIRKFLRGDVSTKRLPETAKQKGVDGKVCWDGYKRMGTKQKGGRTVDNCVPIKK